MVGLFRPFGIFLVFASVFSLTVGELQSKVGRKTIIVKGPSLAGNEQKEMNFSCINSHSRITAVVSAASAGCQNPGSSFGV